MGQTTLVLADIGGYTPFLEGVGLEHAREITTDLLNGMLKANDRRWQVAKLEGDCVFFYREGREPPDSLLGHVAVLFEDFCHRVIEISARSSCPCGACSRVNQLALKFVVHAGEAAEQRIGRSRELIGRDVVVAHRLLKNGIPLEEYVLLTDAYLEGQPVPWSPAPQPAAERYDDVGQVPFSYLDLSPERRALEERTRIFLTPETARISVSVDIEAPADPVWGVLSDREQQDRWDSTLERIAWAPGRAPKEWGSVHTCFHRGSGPAVHVLVALDNERRMLTERLFLATSLARDVYVTLQVEPLEGARSRASFLVTFKEAKAVLSHVLGWPIRIATRRAFRQALDDLRRYCEAEHRRSLDAPAEPS